MNQVVFCKVDNCQSIKTKIKMNDSLTAMLFYHTISYHTSYYFTIIIFTVAGMAVPLLLVFIYGDCDELMHAGWSVSWQPFGVLCRNYSWFFIIKFENELIQPNRSSQTKGADPRRAKGHTYRQRKPSVRHCDRRYWCRQEHNHVIPEWQQSGGEIRRTETNSG